MPILRNAKGSIEPTNVPHKQMAATAWPITIANRQRFTGAVLTMHLAGKSYKPLGIDGGDHRGLPGRQHDVGVLRERGFDQLFRALGHDEFARDRPASMAQCRARVFGTVRGLRGWHRALIPA